MPKELKIKRESLAERCEICHQSDQFDPATNRCSRCELVPLNPDQSGSESELNPQDFKKWANGYDPMWIGIATTLVFHTSLALTLLILSEIFDYERISPLLILGIGFFNALTGLSIALGFGNYVAKKMAKTNNSALSRTEGRKLIIYETMLVNFGFWLVFLICFGITWVWLTYGL